MSFQKTQGLKWELTEWDFTNIKIREKLANYPCQKINRSILTLLQDLHKTNKCKIIHATADALLINLADTTYYIAFEEGKEFSKITIEAETVKKRKRQMVREEYLFEGEMTVVIKTAIEAKKPFMQRIPIEIGNQIVATYINDPELVSPIHMKKTELYYENNYDFFGNEVITSTNIIIKEDNTAMSEDLYGNYHVISTQSYSANGIYCTPNALPSEPRKYIPREHYEKFLKEWFSENPNVKEYTLSKYIFGTQSTEQCQKEFKEYLQRLKNFKGNFKTL